MIQLIINSGLGNQLFQYAYARCLQEAYAQNGVQETLAINPYFIQHREFKGSDRREMSLQHFVLNDSVAFLETQEQEKGMGNFKKRCVTATPLVELFRWRVKRIKKDKKSVFDYRAKRGLYYAYSAYTDFTSLLSNKKDKFVFGFFQSENNFKTISGIIRKELKVKDAPSDANREMIARIQKDCSVCLHIRRGDYLNPFWKNLQVCSFEYYNNAINKILDMVNDPVFYVFSNTHEDLNWIKENYHFFDKMGCRKIKLVYVDLSNTDYEELRLMYNCKHFIISNSTFSWWGAWLSDSKDKVVCAPVRWNLTDDNDGNIYVQSWIKVGC